MKTTSLQIRAPRDSLLFVCQASDVAPSGAAGVLLSGYRGFATRRAVLPKSTPWLVRLFPDRRRWLSVAAARAAAALSGLVATAARRLHGGAVLWSTVPQQLTSHPKLVSLLGRLLGKLAMGFNIIRVHVISCFMSASHIITGNNYNLTRKS